MMNWFAIDPKLMRQLLNITAWNGTGQAAATPGSLIVRPAQTNDVDLLLEMHQRLSEETVYNRYLSPRIPTRQEMMQICQLGGENGRVLVAATAGRKPAIVALAYYIVSDKETAEVALLVEDGYQGQGLGKRLLHQLICLAIVQGIHYFDAFVLPANRPMLHLLHNAGLVVQNRDWATELVRCAFS